jgi:pimeloyl-ACP methyl ester carboxylesterase
VADDGTEFETDFESQQTALKQPRRLLLCQQGLSDRTIGADRGLFALCESVEEAGFDLVWDGDYPAFGALDENGAYQALFSALDTNNDGAVDNNDKPTLVHLVGFSWGGINVTDIAARLGQDARVHWQRRGVSGMVLFDPYQLLVTRATIPANVLDAWVYRQTETTEGDCSAAASFGYGFNGRRPKATSDLTLCSDYDLDEMYDSVGHCDVPSVAADAAYQNLVLRRNDPALAPWAVDCPLN